MASSTTLEGNFAGQEKSDNGPGMVFCWCPAGSFRMGSDDVFDTWEMTFVPPEVVTAHNWSPSQPDEVAEAHENDNEGSDGENDDENDDDVKDPAAYWGRFEDESPVDVTLRQGFWIGKYPVTQAEYEVVMGPGSNHSKFRDQDDSARRPVDSVGWEDAVMFCREFTELERAAGRINEEWAYRLPTEAQWEYACRAGTRARYYSGDNESDLERVAFFRTRASKYDLEARKKEQTHAVGQKTPNAWGLHDTLGNVDEWCRDTYQTGLPGGLDPVTLPVEKNDRRVVRGGNYHAPAYECRVSSRKQWYPDSRFNVLGFRVALVRVVEGEAIDPREQTAESPLFTRRKAAVEGRPIPEPPASHDELLARAEAFLAKPNPRQNASVFDEMNNALLQSYVAGEFPSDQEEARAFLVLAIAGTKGDLKSLYGDVEDYVLERAALYRGMYQLFYDEDPDEYQHPGARQNEEDAEGESST